MNAWLTKAGKLLLAMLLVAQLCLAAHAAEHGGGSHSHGDVVCPVALGNDDDPDLVQSTELLHAPDISLTLDAPLFCQTMVILRVLQPPATGPPAYE